MTESKRVMKKTGRLQPSGLFEKVVVLVWGLACGMIFTEEACAMGTSGGQQGGGLTAFLPLILIVVVFYFLLIRPQTKRQKEHKMLLSNLAKGDKVVTNSGMLGTIVGIDDKENKVVLKVAENVKIEFLKSSIAGRVGSE